MLTTELEESLKRRRNFDEDTVKDNAAPELIDVLCRYIDENKMTKADLIRKLNVDRNYGYQMLNGVRRPTRNCLIQIALILKLDAEQLNYLLRLGGKSQLYVRNVMDAKIFYAIEHHMEYFDALDFIWGDSEI